MAAMLGTRWDWVIYTSANAVTAAIARSCRALSCRSASQRWAMPRHARLLQAAMKR
jgi:hypothetical protein